MAEEHLYENLLIARNKEVDQIFGSSDTDKSLFCSAMKGKGSCSVTNPRGTHVAHTVQACVCRMANIYFYANTEVYIERVKNKILAGFGLELPIINTHCRFTLCLTLPSQKGPVVHQRNRESRIPGGFGSQGHVAFAEGASLHYNGRMLLPSVVRLCWEAKTPHCITILQHCHGCHESVTNAKPRQQEVGLVDSAG